MTPPSSLLALLLLGSSVSAIPAPAQYFTQQVDHFAISSATYQQRYYVNASNFAGVGHPIILIMGGEGGIAPSTGIFYPSVVLLAQRLGAYIVEPEHRGYGESLPVETTNMSLITPMQAMADAATLVLSVQQSLNCTGRPGSGQRCPVISVGGSYPGWLAMSMRVRYPGVVDAGYSASSPHRIYNQAVDQYAYYKIITDSAAKLSPGCPAAVRSMLASTLVGTDKAAIVSGLNLCTPLPAYIDSAPVSTLVDELNMVVMYTFATLNMGSYPPPNTALLAACQMIEAQPSPWTALSNFLTSYSTAASRRLLPAASPIRSLLRSPAACYNLSNQLPSGANATISSGDWSGVGVGKDGTSWDFETCTLLVEPLGVNGVSDMFLPREWTMDWLRQHCASRFGVTPTPRLLPDLWGLDESRLPSVTSRIVFTNGLQDGWSAGGIQTNLSDTLLAFNMPNGAHHSDLSHSWPGPSDTPDVTAVRAAVSDVLAGWMAQVMEEERARFVGQVA